MSASVNVVVRVERPDLAAKVEEACRVSRQMAGLDPETPESSPSAVTLLIAAEIAGIPVGVLLGEPAVAALIGRLTRELEELRTLVAEVSID